MFDMVVTCLKFSQSYFLILSDTSTFEQCYYIKNPKRLKDLAKFSSKKRQTKNEFLGAFLDDFSSQHCNPDHSTLGYFYV